MAWLFNAPWHGSHRAIRCPYCGRKQVVARRPMPFDGTCQDCRRPFRVTDAGAIAIGKK
jgi:hypothetical protein